MKRYRLSFKFLFLMGFFVSLSSLQAKGGQGIAYYNAGFPQSAKSILIEELTSNPTQQEEICFYLGNIYFGENLPDSASFYFTKGMTANPLSAINTIGLSMIKIKSNPDLATQEIDAVLKIKTNKKNPDFYIAAARAYLSNGIIDKAIFYHDKAQSVKSKYALTSVLLGDIELAKNDVGNACRNYEMAILYDASCKEAYIKYARAYRNVNAALAIEMLGKLKAQDPSFLLVDKELADIYYSTNEFDKAAQLYETFLKSGNSNVQDLTKYAMTLFLNHDFVKSLEVANMGLQKSPRNPAFNRLAMYNNVDLKLYPAALLAADSFFNKSDKPDLSYLDYRYFGQALRESQQYDSAIVQYQNALKLDSTKVELWKDISAMYDAKGDYVKSISAYTSYLNTFSADKKTADDIIALGKIYYNQGNDSISVSEKKIALLKADSLFEQVVAIEADNYRGNFWRARANSALDPETTQGLAKPFYEQTASFIELKADPRYNSILVECYSYLGYYFLVKKDNKNSKLYWNKILVLDPENSTAKKAIEGIK